MIGIEATKILKAGRGTTWQSVTRDDHQSARQRPNAHVHANPPQNLPNHLEYPPSTNQIFTAIRRSMSIDNKNQASEPVELSSSVALELEDNSNCTFSTRRRSRWLQEVSFSIRRKRR